MVEVSEIGIKEDELELELGLSIGGSFRKLSDTPKPVERESGFPVDSKSNGFHLDRKEILTAATSRSRTTSRTVFESEREVPDPKTKREIHALRRQEAKKKQKEKRCRGRNSINSSDSQTVSEDQQRASKREKTAGSNGVENGTPNPIYGGQTVHYGSVGPTGVQYSYAPVQFVPYTNGFAYPCVIPCWAPSPSPPPPPPGGKEKNGVFQPVACCGFRPFVAGHPGLGLSLPNGCNSEKSGGKDGESRKTASYGSPVCSSSTISDHHNSSSREGDGSSETRTQSSHSSAEQNRGDSPKPNDIKGPSPEVQSSCSQQTESAQSINTDEFKEQAKPGFDSAALEKPMFTTENSSPNSLSKDVGKPPKPQSLSRSLTTPPAAFPQMPYVSTRGNGPKGKTIYGFLYRYTNSEVSIVCVCHGSTFSPAEFVQHAGGTDVSQPLKHITVMPSAFG